MTRKTKLPRWTEDDRRLFSPAYRARVDRTIELLEQIAAAQKLTPSRSAAARRQPAGTIRIKEQG